MLRPTRTTDGLWNRAFALAMAALIALAIVSLSGCNAAGERQRSARTWRGEALPNDGVPLALAAQDMEAVGWEYSRRDADLGAVGSPILTIASVAEVRQYERQRDINGRPRNDSWSFSRSIQRRVGP